MAETSVTTYLSDRKKARLESGEADSITTRGFNVVMCGVLAWGFLVNAAMVYFLGDMMMQAAVHLKWWMLLLAYLVPTFAGVFIAARSTNPFISFVGYNLVVLPIGLMLAMILPAVPVGVVTKAMAITAMVTLTMLVLAMVAPQFFLGLGRTLLVALIVGLLAEVVATFLLGYRGMLFDWLFVILFSGYIGYDVAKSQAFPKTLDNAVDSALDIYLDIINLFIRLVSILSRNN
jgi:FtsH-binding integral membrane protein